jgi:hypothetical protein
VRRLAPIVLVVLAACSSPDASVSTSPSPMTSPSPPTSASPSTDAARPFVGDGAALEPGRYRFDAFSPPLTFVVGEGWVGGHTVSEYFDIFHGDELVIGFGRPEFVGGADGNVEVGELTPRTMLATIGGNVARSGSITSTELGGLPAFEMSFHVRAPTAVFGGPNGRLTIEPRWDQRAITLDVGGVVVLVLVQWTADATASDLSAADDVLRTIRFD